MKLSIRLHNLTHRMIKLNILTLISALLFSLSSVHAGEVRLWTPKELLERSTVVIIGRPIQIEATGKKGTMKFNDRLPLIPTDIYSAKVEIIQVIKGDKLIESGQLKVKELAMTFSRVGETVIIDTQYVHRINLTKDRLFLMYLNQTEDGSYFNALEGEVNDYQAAKPLILTTAAEERDGKPATTPDSGLEGRDKTQSESEGYKR